jgi:hypothetical protein
MEEMNVPEMDAGGDMDCCDDAITDPPKVDTMADDLIATPDITKLFFGEVIGSFRQLLKRDYLAEVFSLPELAFTHLLRIQRAAFPSYGGVYVGPTVVNSQVIEYGPTLSIVPVATTMLNYVSRMFLGWRGSIRWTIDTSGMPNAGADGFSSSTVTYGRNTQTNRSYDLTVFITPSIGDPVSILNIEDGITGLGSYLGNTRVNPLHTIEVPFYSNKRFISTNQEFSYASTIEVPSFLLSSVQLPSNDSDEFGFLKFYCSAGEDFNLFFFNGMPPFYLESTLPTAS